jgi:hypothetical protein
MNWTIERMRRLDIEGCPWQVEARSPEFEVCALEFITGEHGEHIPIVTATDGQVAAWADRCQAYQATRRRA